MVRIFKGSCLAKRILAVVSQQGLVLVSMAVVVSPFGFSEMQGEGESGQVWEPVCRLFHWTSVAKRAVV